jgi:hypothetical protein
MFRTFLQAGFECSTHKHRTGRRLDLLRATRHDCLAHEDYRRLHSFGIGTVRVGARWHLIEESPGEYNFGSLACLFDAAERNGTEVLLDLLHFGWPEHVDIFSSAFPTAFSRFVHAVTKFVKQRGNCCHKFAPVNEISFLSWAGADVAAINPYTRDRGAELKRNLIRGAAAASEVLLNELAGVRLIWPEPVIHIVGHPAIPGDDIEAERYRLAQYQAWDMLSGRMAPELGGRPEYLDVIGVNFYDRNQWVHHSRTLTRADARYRPFHQMLEEVWTRYRRPMFISETGTEDDGRADWFNYICDEVVTAHHLRIPVHGICLYPIINHPGWDDDRHCCNGLFDYADAHGHREVHWPLAHAILNQKLRLERSYQFTHDADQHRSDLLVPSSVGFRFSTASAPNEPVRAYPEGLLS